MRNLKRALSLLLSSTMVLGMVVMGGSAAGYQDVDASNDNQEAIEVLQAVGIMSGVDAAGNFNPDGSLTRNEMAVVMAHLLNLDYDYYRGTNTFSDVPEWAAPYVAACVAEGVTAGIGNGLYGGDQKITAAQAGLMVMKALGYFQNQEDFGTDWQVATIRQASYINLFDKVNSDAESALTRGQVAQLVLNGLKSDMVDFTGDKGIQIGDVTVGYRAEYTSKTSSAAKYNTLVGGKTDIAQQGQYYIQLGEELYNGKLTMRADTDVFQRPATTWTYNSDTIGTYVDFDLMVGEYTTSATGKELYNAVGKTAFDQYDFYGYVNGVKDDLCDSIAKNNDHTVDPTDNGALTQVFVDNDAKEVVVTVINTYLAQATADYNEKKNTANFDIYGLTGEKGTVSGDDFDVTGIKMDDFVLVTYADDEIQSISAVKTLSEVEISKFSTNGTATTVTVDGTKYDASATLNYDPAVLDNYTDKNLKDTIYNVYLDQYGYVIGVDIVEAPAKYVFITGVDENNSNLANKTWTANAIFVDGTSAVIEVENDGTIVAGAELINKWYTYTKSNSDVYTLENVAETAIIGTDAADVAQYRTASSDVDEINAKNISLKGNGTDVRVYGNENTVYLLAELDKVHTDRDYAVIKGVDEVVTGVNNASFTVWGWAGVKGETGVSYTTTPSNDDYGNKVLSNGTYALYGDDGYVIAAVVVGESDSVSKNIAYAIDGSVSSESYNSTTKMWTWTRDVIIDGQEVELVETNDKDVSVLEDKMDGGKWYTVKYDADGNVKDVVEFNAAHDGADYQTTIAGAVGQITADNDFIVVHVANEDNQYTLKGNTLYDLTNNELGFLVASDVKIALSQVVNNKRTVTYDESSATLKAILEDLNGDAKDYDFNAVIKDGRATSVIIIDNSGDGGITGPNGSTNDGKLELNALTFANDGMKVNFTNKTGSAFLTAAKASIVVKNADGNLVYTTDNVAVTGTSVANNASADITFTGYTAVPSNTGNYTVTLTITAGHGTFTVTQTLGTV